MTGPAPNGDVRIAELGEAVQLVTEIASRATAAAEYARSTADDARETARDARETARSAHELIGEATRELALMRQYVEQVSKDTALVRTEIREVRKLLGEWPRSPDDTGSGVAGRVAMISHHDPREIAARTLTESERPPRAVVEIWKRHRRLGAMLALLLALLLGAIQSGAIQWPK